MFAKYPKRHIEKSSKILMETSKTLFLVNEINQWFPSETFINEDYENRADI